MFTGREFSKESESYFYKCCYKNDWDKESELLRTVFNRAFFLGAQYAIHTSSELSPHVARFMEFIMWLTEREERKDTSELEVTAPY